VPCHKVQTRQLAKERAKHGQTQPTRSRACKVPSMRR
jgi:hypothetical protein